MKPCLPVNPTKLRTRQEPQNPAHPKIDIGVRKKNDHPTDYWKLWKFEMFLFSNIWNFLIWNLKHVHFLGFWLIFGLIFGFLAKDYVECSAPVLTRRLGAEFPGDRFFREHRYILRPTDGIFIRCISEHVFLLISTLCFCGGFLFFVWCWWFGGT